MNGILLCRTGPAAPASYKLDRPSMTIGREGDVDIAIPSREVSRRHAKIVFEDGGYYIEDLRSTNGTFVNTIPVTKEALNHLDVVTFGKSTDLIFLARASVRKDAEESAVVKVMLVPEQGETVTISGPAVTIGRMAPCEVILGNPAVSKKHARIEVQDTRVVLTDLGSANGTFVNGERVTSRDLRAGDAVSFGRSPDMKVRIVRGRGEDPARSPAARAAAPAGATQAVWSVNEIKERLKEMEATLPGIRTPAGSSAPPSTKPAAARPQAPPTPPTAPEPPPASKAAAPEPGATRIASAEEVRKALAGVSPPPAPPSLAGEPGATKVASAEEIHKALASRSPQVPASIPGATKVASAEEIRKALASRSPQAPAPEPGATKIASAEEIRKALEERKAQGQGKEPARTRIASSEEIKKALAAGPVPPSPGAPSPAAASDPPPTEALESPEKASPPPATQPPRTAPPPPDDQLPPTVALDARRFGSKPVPDSAAPQTKPAERTLKLIPVESGMQEVTFTLGAEPKTIGRTVKDGVRIEDSRISRRHATFRLEGDSVLLADEGSANGTFVNGQRIKQARLKSGDQIRFGAAAFRLEIG